MPDHVELNGVRTWYDERGEGEPLVLLHPGMTDSRAWEPNIDALAARFHVFTPERRAHGHTPDVEGPLSFDDMAADTVAFLEQVVGGPAHLAGCSDGATVALLTALRRPELVRRLAFVAGVFHHEGWHPSAIDPDNAPPQFMAEAYGELSPDGIEHFPVVVEKMAELHLVEPALTADGAGRGSRARPWSWSATTTRSPSSTPSRSTARCPTASSPSSPGPRTGCWSRRPTSATGCCSSFSARIRSRRSRPSAAGADLASLAGGAEIGIRHHVRSAEIEALGVVDAEALDDRERVGILDALSDGLDL